MKKLLTTLLKNEVLVVSICFAIFVGLIAISIGKFSVWHDESYTATLIESNYSGIIERTGNDVHPPLYYLLLKTWSLVFGDSIMALRLFSSVSMLVAIWIVWRLMRKTYGIRIGQVTLLALCIGPFLVRDGQEMRMYGLAALLASAATFLYVRTMTQKMKWQYAIAYGTFVAAGIYTHYFFILVPLVHFIHLMIFTKGYRIKNCMALRPFIPSVITAGALLMPWAPVVMKQYNEVQGAFWIGPVGVETLTSTPIAMTVFQKQYEMTGLLGLLAVIALASVAVSLKKYSSDQKDRTSKLFLSSVVIPPAFLFLLSIPPFQPSYQDRYMSFFAPIFYSVLAIGALAMKKNKFKFISLAFLISLLGIGQFYQYRDGNNHGWNPKPHFTMNEIADTVTDGAPVYSTSLWTFFDAHITMNDRGYKGEVKLLLKDYPEYKMGNWSAVYGRPELFATMVPEEIKSFWVIDESNPQYSGNALVGFSPEEIKSFGYATLTHYIKN